MPQDLPIYLDDDADDLSGRETQLEAIAIEAASGATCAQLARRHGYTYGGMSRLLTRESVHERVAYYQRRLRSELTTSQAKLLLNLTSLLDRELALALPLSADGETPAPDVAGSQKARQYLIDKVLVPTSKIETTTTLGTNKETAEAITEFRNLLRRINEEAGQRTKGREVLDSPHVREGQAALPALLPATSAHEVI